MHQYLGLKNKEKGYDVLRGYVENFASVVKQYDRDLNFKRFVINKNTGEPEAKNCSCIEIYLLMSLSLVKYTFYIRILENGRFVDKLKWNGFIRDLFAGLYDGYVDEGSLKDVWDDLVTTQVSLKNQINQLFTTEELVHEAHKDCRSYCLNLVAVLYSMIVDYIIDFAGIEIYRDADFQSEVATRVSYVIGALSYGEVTEFSVEKAEENSDEDPMEDLNKLIGLDSVKEDVKTLINLIKVRKMRVERGLKINDMSLHMVFTGNPGTGKTTVARIISRIYKKLGVLSKGHFVEASRVDLVAEYVGQSAVKTKKVIDSAKGGVLFIDEAYSLSVDSDKDFGHEVISTLLKEMEDSRGDLIVIVAGYPELMKNFLDSNPGLKSRFNKFIHFNDYSEDELSQIYELMGQEEGYKIEVTLKDALKEKLEEAKKQGNFANARSVRNIFEKSLANQANRLVDTGDFSTESLQLLTAEDIQKVKDTSKVKEDKRQIGF